MSDEPVEYKRTFEVKLQHVVRPASMDAPKGILVMLTLFLMIYVVLNGAIILTYAGAIFGLFMFVIFGAAIGAGVMYVWADKPTRVKYLNMMRAGKNYCLIPIFKTGKREITHVVELGDAQSLEIGKKRFIINKDEVRMHDGAPTLCYDERNATPINFDAGLASTKLTPELFSIAIQKEREYARLQVTNWGKALMNILWIIVAVAGLSALVGILNYFKLDDVAKGVIGIGQQAIDAAKGVIK